LIHQACTIDNDAHGTIQQYLDEKYKEALPDAAFLSDVESCIIVVCEFACLFDFIRKSLHCTHITEGLISHIRHLSFVILDLGG